MNKVLRWFARLFLLSLVWFGYVLVSLQLVSVATVVGEGLLLLWLSLGLLGVICLSMAIVITI